MGESEDTGGNLQSSQESDKHLHTLKTANCDEIVFIILLLSYFQQYIYFSG